MKVLSRAANIAALVISRGKSVRICAAAFAFLASLAPNALESAAANGDTRTIFLFHSHSKESIAATFRVNGHYDGEVLEKLNWFLRDWRNDEPTKMDPRLFDVLWEAYRSAERMGPDDPIVVVSAYRCPATNAMLRRRSRAVAEHSQHMLGKAMDSTMPGLSMEKLREIGMRMQRGGVGYYPTAGTPFVHLDVGGVRHWPRMNYDQLVRLFPDGKTVHLPSNGHPLAGYEEAKAEIEARGGETISIAEANRGDGIRSFFARLFGGGGGGGEDEEEAAAAARPTRVAAARQNPAATQDPATANAARKMVASAETNLPRGETYLGAPDATQNSQPVAAVTPEPAAAFPAAAPAPRPTPLEEPTAEAEAPAPAADMPLPPRRPDALTAALEVPLPPPRPAELAGLPDVITHGARLALRPGSDDVAPLAYAASAALVQPAFAPLPPPRPPMPPLRAAALGKAEETRAAKAVAAQITPARVDRATLQAMVAPAPAMRAVPPTGGGVAPPLRPVAKLDVFAAHAPAKGVPTHFSNQSTQLSADAFTKKLD